MMIKPCQSRSLRRLVLAALIGTLLVAPFVRAEEDELEEDEEVEEDELQGQVEEEVEEATQSMSNQTEPSSTNTTDATPPSSSSSPTTSPTTSSSTAATTKKPARKKKTKTKKKEDKDGQSFCGCDLTPKGCDVDCCCDEDCSESDAAAFGRCEDAAAAGRRHHHSRYCFSTDFIFANNTRAVVETTSDGLLCIRRDNLPEAATYLDRAPLENATEFRAMESRHRRFLWGGHDDGAVRQARPANDTYRAGDPIVVYVLDGEQFGLLTVPSPLGGGGGVGSGSRCGVPNPIRYMEDRRTECRVHIETVPDCRWLDALDAATFVRGYLVARSPRRAFNSTGAERRKGDSGVFVEVEVQLCQRDGDGNGATTCVQQQSGGRGRGRKEDLLPRPTLDCKNVLRELHLEVRHNGTEGIDRVVARLFLEDLETGAAGPLVQTFSYSHFWTAANASEEDAPMPRRRRSGNPGYLKGSPLVVGRLATDADAKPGADGDGASAKDADSKVTVDQDSWKGLSLMPLPSTGSCLTGKGGR